MSNSLTHSMGVFSRVKDISLVAKLFYFVTDGTAAGGDVSWGVGGPVCEGIP